MILAGCGSSKPQEAPQTPPAAEAPSGTSDRKAIAQADCESQGGTVVGDIGDGATQRPGYMCPSGKAPLGSIAPAEGGPTPVEGAVCCPQ